MSQTCPSCPLQDMSYDDQLAHKRDRLMRALGAYPRLADIEVAEVRAAPNQRGYRNRARMLVIDDAQQPQGLLGFYEEGSRRVVPVEHCEAHHPQLEAVLDGLRPLLFAYAAVRDFARFVDVRCTAGHGAGQEAAIITFAGELAGEADEQTLVEQARVLHTQLAQRLDELRLSVHLNVAERSNQAILAGEQRVVAGDAWLEFSISDRPFRVPPTAFFQVNLDQIEAVHRRMDELAGGWKARGDKLVDLYCGVGVHGIALAGEHEELLGTDAAADAIDWAEKNARRADIHAYFLAADDVDAVGWLADQLDDAPYDLITNPARAGMSHQAVALGARTQPVGLLYLSCEPRTLARDLDRLIDHGFEVAAIEPFDFMPQTDQVETLVSLVPAEPTELARERAYQPADPAQRRFAPGVSGPRGLEEPVDESVWVALVAGETPKHGFLPKARGFDDQPRVEVDRLRKVEGNSVLRLRFSALDDDQLRQRLRAWEHPVVGDPEYGDRQVNHLAAHHSYLDRMALHCVAARVGESWHRAAVPGAFMGLMRLPRKVLETT